MPYDDDMKNYFLIFLLQNNLILGSNFTHFSLVIGKFLLFTIIE